MISVVIPTRHRNESLAVCLARLAPSEQTLPADRYEVIVTDDGSASTSESMIRTSFPWARWTLGPRRGPAANRNHGVSVSRGRWIAFTDDDCVPSPAWLAAYQSSIRDGVELYEGRTTCEKGLTCFAVDAPINLNGGTFPSCNLMITRRLFDDLGGFDENFLPNAMMEDIDFRTRVLAGDRPWQFVPDATVDHPPRRRVTGKAAGLLWENRVYYDLKWTNRTDFRRWLPLFVFKVRVSQMLREHRRRDIPVATWSMLCELRQVCQHVSQWQVDHAERARRARGRR